MKKTKKLKKKINPCFVIGIISLFLGIILFIGYFHIIDNLVNYMDLSMTMGSDKINMLEYSIDGTFIGGYAEQHLTANRMFYYALILFVASFISFILGGKWNN